MPIRQTVPHLEASCLCGEIFMRFSRDLRWGWSREAWGWTSCMTIFCIPALKKMYVVAPCAIHSNIVNWACVANAFVIGRKVSKEVSKGRQSDWMSIAVDI